MNRKLTAIALLLMAFVGLSVAGAVSAQPTVPNPFAPQPSYWWPQIDSGNKIIYNNPRNLWDDQWKTYKTYKWRLNRNHVKIYIKTFKKSPTNTWPWWRWTANKSTVKSLDKNSRFWLKINTVNYNSAGYLTGSNTRYVFTRFDAVRYYNLNENSLVRT